MPDEKQITNDVLNDKIVIRKEYFENIQTAINSINEFFTSNFKTKNFPVRDGSFELDKCLETIIELIDNVDVTWVTDQQKATDILNEIFEVTDKIDVGGYGSIYEALHNNGDTSTLQKIEAFMGYYTLTTIGDNFQDFSELINGIYSFELFTKPSKYKNVIETFSKHINMEQLESLFNEESNDIPSIFNSEVYVNGIFESEFIDIPDTLNKEDELRRINEFRDSTVEVLIDENNDTVQEAAEVNFFEDDVKSHIKYNDKQNKFQISKQYQKIVNDFISEIEKCDDTDELSKVFTNNKASKYPDDLMNVCVPFIVCKVFNNKNKYPFDKFNVDELGKFTKSYKSIADKNPGAKRFVNYDLFSVFKTDKEGTIKFLRDYFTLALYNDADAYISNNTILTLFNIFDSRIYFDILYNSIPAELKKTKFSSEDKFVKDVRAKVNKNSRNANVYKSDNTKKASDAKDSKAVTEYVSDCLKEYGDMSITDMMYCEHYQSLIKEEIACIGDVMYNKNVSPKMIDKYINESYVQESFFNNVGFLNLRSKIATALGSDFVVSNMMNPMGSKEPRFTIKNNEDTETTINIDSMGNAVAINIMNGYNMKPCCKGISLSAAFNKILSVIKEIFPSTVIHTESVVQEQETGDIPEYMRNRIMLTDESNDEKQSNEHRHAEATLDLGVDDLATSIDAKLAYGGDTLDETLGSGFKPANSQDAKKAESQIVYNITNNYTNSFNKDSNNTTTNTTTNNDLSSNKNTETTNNTTNTNSHNDSSRNKDNSQRKSISNVKPDNSRGINNNNNNNTGKDFNDTKDDIDVNTPTLSNGKTIQEVFAFLESEEPLSDKGNAGAGEPPKSDLLTVAMDIDKNTLANQQDAKKKLQKAVNTGKAFLKPVSRAKKWLTDMIDSLIKRDEDKVKAEIIENPSYRTSLYKAMRLGLKLGLTGVCFTISGYLGAAYLVMQGAKYADKQRLKKEVQAEFGTEIKIINEKIDRCPETEEGRKARYQLMRLRSKMEKMLADSPKSTFKSIKSVI